MGPFSIFKGESLMHRDSCSCCDRLRLPKQICVCTELWVPRSRLSDYNGLIRLTNAPKSTAFEFRHCKYAAWISLNIDYGTTVSNPAYINSYLLCVQYFPLRDIDLLSQELNTFVNRARTAVRIYPRTKLASNEVSYVCKWTLLSCCIRKVDVIVHLWDKSTLVRMPQCNTYED